MGGVAIVFLAGKLQCLLRALGDMGLQVDAGATGGQQCHGKDGGEGSVVDGVLDHGKLEILRMIGLVAPI